MKQHSGHRALKLYFLCPENEMWHFSSPITNVFTLLALMPNDKNKTKWNLATMGGHSRHPIHCTKKKGLTRTEKRLMGQTLGLIRNVNLIILESSLDHTADLVAVKKQKLPTPNLRTEILHSSCWLWTYFHIRFVYVGIYNYNLQFCTDWAIPVNVTNLQTKFTSLWRQRVVINIA
jgi:hypothetical protein